MSNGGVRGEAGKTVGASALQSQTQAGKRGACPAMLICLHQPQEGLSNRLQQHGGFRPPLLLPQNPQGLGKIGGAPAQLFPQDADLRVLTPQTEYRCSRYVRVMDVPCNQSAQIV